MVQVQPERDHGDEVDDRQPPHAERVHEQVVRVVGGAAGDVHLADGEVQQVPDDEEQQGEAAPAHHPRGERRGEVLLHLVLHRAGPGAAPPQRHRAVDVHHERAQQDRADHPQQARVRQHRLTDGAQVLGVLVVGVVAGEGLEVAVHV